MAADAGGDGDGKVAPAVAEGLAHPADFSRLCDETCWAIRTSWLRINITLKRV